MIIVLSICILGISTYVGVGISNYYKMRTKIFSDIILFCDLLENNMSYNMLIIKDVVSNNLHMFKSDFKNILKKYLSYVENMEEIKKEKITSSYLEPDEILNVQNLFLLLGKTSLENELKLISSFKNIFLKYKEENYLRNKKNSSLSIKMGFLVGCCLVVLLI